MWGNLFFFLGSVGYLYTAYTAYFHVESEISKVVNIFLASLFIFDSMCYLFAIFWSENSKVRFTPEMKIYFKSDIDWYLIATILYICGSVTYVVQAVQVYLLQDSSLSNLIAASVFMVDGPLYVASSFHKRDDDADSEVDIFHRRYIFIIEKGEDLNTYLHTGPSSDKYVAVSNQDREESSH